MITPNDFEIFQGKTFSDLCKDVFKNQKTKSEQIDLLINELKPYITDISSVQLLAPTIKDYLEISVKNDEQLIKMMGVAQRHASKGSSVIESSSEKSLSDEEKQQLLDSLKEAVDNDVEIEEEIKEIKEKSKKTKK